jgi:hypothetical protein
MPKAQTLTGLIPDPATEATTVPTTAPLPVPRATPPRDPITFGALLTAYGRASGQLVIAGQNDESAMPCHQAEYLIRKKAVIEHFERCHEDNIALSKIARRTQDERDMANKELSSSKHQMLELQKALDKKIEEGKDYQRVVMDRDQAEKDIKRLKDGHEKKFKDSMDLWEMIEGANQLTSGSTS